VARDERRVRATTILIQEDTMIFIGPQKEDFTADEQNDDLIITKKDGSSLTLSYHEVDNLLALLEFWNIYNRLPTQEEMNGVEIR
jgi:hypothetical protein